MSVRFHCEKCHHEIVVSLLKPGEIARCKRCGTENVVPPTGNLPHASTEQGSNSAALATPSSIRTGLGLLTFLWIQLGLDALLFLLAYTSQGVATPFAHGIMGGMALILIATSTLVSIVAVVVFFIWILDLHRDLARLFDGYTVSPGQAFARLLIPVFNLWGTWNVFVTIVRAFQEDSDQLRRPGTTLQSWLVVMYSALVLSYLYVGEKIVTAIIPRQTISYQDLFTDWDLFGIVLAIVTLIAYIGMTQTISLALREKHRSLGSDIQDSPPDQAAP